VITGAQKYIHVNTLDRRVCDDAYGSGVFLDSHWNSVIVPFQFGTEYRCQSIISVN